MNEEDLDKHQILTSTPIKVIPGVCDESVAPDSPTVPGFSPVSLSSNEVDDDRQRQEEKSTIMEQQQESTFHLQSPELLKEPCEEADLEPQNQCYRGVVDNIDTTIHPCQQRYDQQTKSLHYCNTMAVQDRIDISKLSDECKKPTQLRQT